MRNYLLFIFILILASTNAGISGHKILHDFNAENFNSVMLSSTLQSQTTPISVESQISDYSGFEVSSQGLSDGFIITTVSGGLAPYDYYWSTGETTSNIVGLEEGEYTLWVTDSNNDVLVEEFLLSAPLEQVIPLKQGWSIISSYIDPTASNMVSIMSDVVNNILVVKDENGNFYWPQYSVDFIGEWLPSEGYFINMLSTDTLVMSGELIQPENVTIHCPLGWSIMGYTRNLPAPVVQMISPIAADVELVKNTNGQVYWPALSLDNIGNMVPNEGYQIKMISPRDFNYPANDQANIIQICPYHILDFDKNIYSVAQIGSQCWMKENLEVTHYSNGTPLVDGTGAGNINGDYTTKYYFDYEDDSTNLEVYGKLYTWNAVMNNASGDSTTGMVQGICPEGWHVPNTSEWNELCGYADSQYDASSTEWNNSGNMGSDVGGNLKEAGELNWLTPNTDATDLVGFSALPGGYRMITGTYLHQGLNGYFWVNQEIYTYSSYFRKLNYNNSKITKGFYSKSNAMSVRCLKN